MSEFDFIIDNIIFSYSALSTYEQCPYAYKLTYIDLKPRQPNFFAEFGTLTHTCLEKYFKGELDSFELSRYFEEQYNQIIKTPSPTSNSTSMEENYKRQGKEFFDNFEFRKEKYDLVQAEDNINFSVKGIGMVARPDLILKEKLTKKNILFDYKTSIPFRTDARTGKETEDKKKIEGYKKQLYLYAYALKNKKSIPIDYMSLWFTRINRIITIPWNKKEEREAINWALDTVDKIKNDSAFSFNNKNNYFCTALCGVRDFCEYK